MTVDDRLALICTLLSEGVDRRTACKAVGWDLHDLRRHLTPYWESRIRECEAVWAIRAARVVTRRIAEDDPDAARWFLERRVPEAWGKHSTVGSAVDRIDHPSHQLSRELVDALHHFLLTRHAPTPPDALPSADTVTDDVDTHDVDVSLIEVPVEEVVDR